MKICVISSEKNIDNCSREETSAIYRRSPRILSVSAVSLMYDPLLISLCNGVADVVELRQGMDLEAARAADLLIVPEAVEPEQEALILSLAAAGKKVFWVRPSANALRQASDGQIQVTDTLYSHRERWDLAGRSFNYSTRCTYDLYQAGASVQKAYAIGDWPSLYRHNGNVFCAASYFNACTEYWNTADDVIGETGFGNAFYSLVVSEVAGLLGQPVPPAAARERFFLRRDFHAYGFARLMVSDLAAMHGKFLDFSAADAHLARAADAFAQGQPDVQVEALLKPAFEALLAQRKTVLDIPVYYADAMHGGILTSRYGYIEIAAPEFVKELMQMFFVFARRRNYRFSMDVSIASWVNLAKRHPSLIQEMKVAMDEGWFEVANGSMGQPFPQFFGLESNIRQFVIGQAAMEKLFGRRAETFLAQEMQLAPVYPTILAQSDFKLALHRVQNTGETVYSDDLCINWQAPDGAGIKTIPTHYDDSQQSISTGFIFWPELITTTAKHYPAGIYTNLLDLTWITSFREDAIRASYYAPVLGKFVTYRDLAGMLKPQRDVVYGRNDYRPQLLTPISWTASDMNALGRRLEAYEMFAALSGNTQVNDALFNAWSFLTAYQNHDNTACMRVPPRGRSGHHLLDVLREDVICALDACQKELGEPVALFNSLSKERAADMYCDKNGTGALKNIPRLDKVDGLEKIVFGAFGLAEKPDASGRAVISQGTGMDNGLLRVVQNPATGALASIYDIKNAHELLAGVGNQIVPGMDGYTRTVKSEKLLRAGVEQLFSKAEMYFADHRFAGWVETTASLPAGERRVYFVAKFVPHGIARHDYRGYHVERKDSIGVMFNLASGFNTIRDCWFNRVHEPLDERGKKYCPGLFFAQRQVERDFLESPPPVKVQSFMGIVAQGESGALVFHNDGAQTYEVDGARVANLLWCTNEYTDTFAYALEALEPGADPYDAFLDYQYEPVPMPRADLTPALQVDHGLWISSIRRQGQDLYVRVVETAGRPVENATLRSDKKILSAARVNFLDDETGILPIHAGSVSFAIGANGMVTVRLRCAG